MSTFDAIIIGAGQAGPSLAGRLTCAGMTVALIERKLFGGTCVNTGCTPTKTLVASAYAAHLARRAGEYGIDIAVPIRCLEILGPVSKSICARCTGAPCSKVMLASNKRIKCGWGTSC